MPIKMKTMVANSIIRFALYDQVISRPLRTSVPTMIRLVGIPVVLQQLHENIFEVRVTPLHGHE